MCADRSIVGFVFRNKDYLLVFLFLILLRALDLYITYRITPDLEFEWNPLVNYFNLSWSEFILVQLLLVGIPFSGYIVFRRRKRFQIKKPNLSLVKFVFHHFNGHDANISQWSKSFFQFPNKRKRQVHFAFAGFLVAISAILASLFAIVNNLFILFENLSYINFLSEHRVTYIPFMLALIVFISAQIYFLIEYLSYRSQIHNDKLEPY